MTTLAELIVAREVREQTLCKVNPSESEKKVRIKVSSNSLKLGTVVVHAKLIFLYFQVSAKQNWYGFTRGDHLVGRLPRAFSWLSGKFRKSRKSYEGRLAR